MCSTPYGIRGKSNPIPRAPKMSKFCAQRLTASEVRAKLARSHLKAVKICAQRLTASEVRAISPSDAITILVMCAQRLTASEVRARHQPKPLNQLLCLPILQAPAKKSNPTGQIITKLNDSGKRANRKSPQIIAFPLYHKIASIKGQEKNPQIPAP